ncbi:MAG: hypothetical protein FWC39_12710 [Bacteroidetes bacterium]|nr:hypothetical protein [Bacteroidota bacterium]
MKKILTTAAAVFALVAVSNAQLFIGGNVGFSTSSETNKVVIDDKIESIKDVSTMGINFNPKVGFQLNDQMSFGASLILGTATVKKFAPTKENDLRNKTVLNKVGIAPFFRYSFVEFGDFKVSADASLPFFIESGKAEVKVGEATISGKTPKTTNVQFKVVPVISYSISDRIDLEAQINVFGLGINFESETPRPEGEGKLKDERNNSTSFNLGISPDDVFTSGRISVGMVFKF